jgi:ribosomal protein S18 acetylase RimI-like enzyme
MPWLLMDLSSGAMKVRSRMLIRLSCSLACLNRIKNPTPIAAAVAEDAGRIVGKLHSYAWDDAAAVMPPDPYIPEERMAVIDAMAPPTPPSWHIEVMAVLPEYQGRGLGGRFIDIAKSQARAENFDLLSLHVFESNEGAIRLYERCGFRVVARAPIPDGFPMADRGGSILMVFP